MSVAGRNLKRKTDVETKRKPTTERPRFADIEWVT